MNKLNKKGFTLIEMLVVIAIIAVLVSIIIPVVGNSTDKAAAATNAANLRSWKATLVTAMLTEKDAVKIKSTAGEGSAVSYSVEVNPEMAAKAPTAKKCGPVEDGAVVSVSTKDGTDIIVKFGNNDIKAFADVAAGDKDASDLAAVSAPSQGG